MSNNEIEITMSSREMIWVLIVGTVLLVSIMAFSYSRGMNAGYAEGYSKGRGDYRDLRDLREAFNQAKGGLHRRSTDMERVRAVVERVVEPGETIDCALTGNPARPVCRILDSERMPIEVSCTIGDAGSMVVCG